MTAPDGRTVFSQDEGRAFDVDADSLLGLLSAGWIGELERLDLRYTTASNAGLRVLARLRKLASEGGLSFHY